MEYGVLLTAVIEELLQQLQAFSRQDTFNDFYAMIQNLRIRQPELAAHTAEAEISRAEDQALNARRNKRTRAHDARLDGDVKRGVFEPVISGRAGSLAQREYFSVRCGIMIRNGRVVSAADHSITGHHQRAYRHLTLCPGSTGQFERLPHEHLMHQTRSIE